MSGQVDTDRLLDVVEALEALENLLDAHNKGTCLEPDKLSLLIGPHVEALRGLWEQAEGSLMPPEERDRRAHVARACREAADKLDGGEAEETGGDK